MFISLETAHSFWMTYFKSSALSDQVFQIYLSKLKECYPRGIEAKEEENEEIIHALARVRVIATLIRIIATLIRIIATFPSLIILDNCPL